MKWHMNHMDVTAIERQLADADISLARLCREAGIAPTTWHRIKTGKRRRPRESTQRVILSALARLLPPEREAA